MTVGILKLVEHGQVLQELLPGIESHQIEIILLTEEIMAINLLLAGTMTMEIQTVQENMTEKGWMRAKCKNMSRSDDKTKIKNG